MLMLMHTHILMHMHMCSGRQWKSGLERGFVHVSPPLPSSHGQFFKSVCVPDYKGYSLVRFYKCSSCGHVFISDEWSAYCPHCGAHGWETDKVFFMKCSQCGRTYLSDGWEQSCSFCGASGWRADDFRFYVCRRCGRHFVSDPWDKSCPFCSGDGMED